MQTFKLWLEPDTEIPEFKKLGYSIVEISVKDVIEKGIHPFNDRYANRTLIEKFLKILNAEEFKPKELAEFKYCEEISSYTREYYQSGKSHFEHILDAINESTRFVESLSYLKLLEIAKNNLKKEWNHNIAKEIAKRVYGSFNDLRSFLRSKNRKVKLSSYEEIDNYNLAEILKLEDFQNEDKILINEGLPVINFRKESFLSKITDERGLLRLTNSIDNFELKLNDNCRVLYSGQKKENKLFLIPHLTDDLILRDKAKEIAEKFRIDNGRYCFATDIIRLTQMVESGSFEISFPGLDYINQHEPSQPSANLIKSEVQRCSIGSYLTVRSSGEDIKELLRNHSVSMTGTKEQLIEKLAKLSVEQYQNYQTEMSNFFKNHRFIRMENGYGHYGEDFPLLPDLDIRNMLLAMFITRHLRGNAILDSSYENDTYDLLALAKSLIKGEVMLQGPFILVVEDRNN
jgi:hypothetical protein